MDPQSIFFCLSFWEILFSSYSLVVSETHPGEYAVLEGTVTFSTHFLPKSVFKILSIQSLFLKILVVSLSI